MYLDLWLEGKNMTLFQLACKLKVQRAYLIRMLKGRTPPTPRIAIDLEIISHGQIKAVEFLEDATKFTSKDPDYIE